MPLLRERAAVGVPDAIQERVADWPSVMEPGFAVKEMMLGIVGVDEAVLVELLAGLASVDAVREADWLLWFPAAS